MSKTIFQMCGLCGYKLVTKINWTGKLNRPLLWERKVLFITGHVFFRSLRSASLKLQFFSRQFAIIAAHSSRLIARRFLSVSFPSIIYILFFLLIILFMFSRTFIFFQLRLCVKLTCVNHMFRNSF